MRAFVRVLTLTALVSAGAASSQEVVGAVAAVNPSTDGARPGETARTLLIREKVIRDERIITDDLGGSQIIFVDRTTLTISPRSDVTLDRYVYDAGAGEGEIVLSVARGAMRIIGGRITKSGEAIIKTPSAIIGVRGGMGAVRVDDSGATAYIHIAGIASTIRSRNCEGACETRVLREGAVVIVEPAPAGVDAGTSAPIYQGVAGPALVNQTLSSPVGAGTGGGFAPVADAEPKAILVSQDLAGSSGDTTQAAISTKAQQIEMDFQTPEAEADPPQLEIADADTAEDLAETIEQSFDQLAFDGTWSAVLVQSNGGVETGDALAFQMRYSLQDETGFAAIELPGGRGVEIDGLSGVLVGDRFVLQGASDEIVASGLTTLSGDAGDTLMQIDAADQLTGTVSIDYEGGALPEVDLIDGQIDPITGLREQTQ